MTEGPYKLPHGWRWVKLQELSKITMGQSPPGTTYNEEGQGLPFFQGKADFGEIYPKPRVWCSAPLKIAQVGDILISVRAPVGPTNLANQVCCIGRGLAAIRPNFGVERFFLLYFLRSIADQLEKLGKGSAFTAITKRQLGEILVPLPPLEEQRRIVARIEELMGRIREARRLREEAKQEAERLWQAVLAETFPRPGSPLPPGWRWVKLGEVTSRDSTIVRPTDFPNRKFNYLGMEHVAPNQWDEPQLIPVLGAEIKSQAIAFYPGCVLYGKLRPYLNKVVVPSKEGIASTEFVPITPKTDVLTPKYLGAFLRSPFFVSYASQNTTGSRQPRVRMDALWNALIPVPPLAEQRRIVGYLETVYRFIKTLTETQLQTEAALKLVEQAILDRAFRGEL